MEGEDENVAANIAGLSLEELEHNVSALSPVNAGNLDLETGAIFHHFASLSFNAFQSTATKLSDARPVFACGGRVLVQQGAFALCEQSSHVSKSKLFSDEETSAVANSCDRPILSWNVAETAVLDDIRAALAPGCSSVTAIPLQLVRNTQRLSLAEISASVGYSHAGGAGTLSMGMLVVGFGHDVSLAVRDTGGDPSRVSDLHWGADAHVDAEITARASDSSHTAFWAACYNHPGLVTTVRATPGTWFAVYHLLAIPASLPADISSLVALEEPRVVQELRELLSHGDTRPIAYFTQFAYAHTELHTVGCADVRTLLRGLDLTIALAAQQLGLAVKAVPVWFRDRPKPAGRFTSVHVPPAPEGDDEDDGEARPMDQRPLIGDTFRAPDDQFINNIREVVVPQGENIVEPSSVRWVNFPQHFAAGAVFDAEHMSFEEEDRLCAWCAVALIIGPPSAANPTVPAMSASSKPEECEPELDAESVNAFQNALDSAFNAVSWMCQGSLPIEPTRPVRVAVDFTASGVAFVQHFPLPAAATDLSAFVAACSPASFGRGKEAVTDESYRKALALEVEHVAVDWHPADHTLVHVIERLLTPTMPPLRAVLGKVNVYGPGNFFKSHVDTPRDVNMVGTLVVCLPSDHTGGGLRLKHEGKEVIAEMSDVSGSPNMRWCAFFSDVEHEVLPVMSGFRVTLTYDLIADLVAPTVWDGMVEQTLEFGPEGQLAVVPRALPMTRPASAGVVQDVLDQLTRILGLTRTQWVGIFCSHAYPQTPRGLVDHKLLKGVDALLWRALADEGYQTMLQQVSRFDPHEAVGEETDPNELPDLNEDWEQRRFERYAFNGGQLKEFYTGGGGDGNEPMWDNAYSRGDFTAAIAAGFTFLNKPRHLLAIGAWDHIMGNWPQVSEVFYGTMCFLIRVPTNSNRAWDRRKHAVHKFAGISL
jgi:hypothetical protein